MGVILTDYRHFCEWEWWYLVTCSTAKWRDTCRLLCVSQSESSVGIRWLKLSKQSITKTKKTICRQNGTSLMVLGLLHVPCQTVKSMQINLWNSFEDGAPIDKICRGTILSELQWPPDPFKKSISIENAYLLFLKICTLNISPSIRIIISPSLVILPGM